MLLLALRPRSARPRAGRAGRPAHPRHQRFPRQSAAAAGRDRHRRSRRQDQEDHGAGRRLRGHGDAGQAIARGPQEHDLRRGRRPDRREPAAVGDVPRRADHRVDVDDGAGAVGGRQSRVRRGQGRIAADAERRLPSGRQMPGAASVSRRQVSLSRRLHLRHRDRQDRLPALRDQAVRRHSRRLHRPDLEGHARHRLAGGRRRPRIPRRGRHRERADSGTEGARRRGHRRPDPRGRHSRPATTTNAPGFPGRSSTSSGSSTRPSMS